MVLDSVVKVARPTHGGNNDRGEIGVTRGTFLPDGAMHAGEGEGNTPDYGLKLGDEVRVVQSYSLISLESDI